MLKSLKERNKVFNGILSVKRGLFFGTTPHRKSFFVAQPIFPSVNIIEEVSSPFYVTSVLTCDPQLEPQIEKPSPFRQKL